MFLYKPSGTLKAKNFLEQIYHYIYKSICLLKPLISSILLLVSSSKICFCFECVKGFISSLYLTSCFPCSSIVFICFSP